MVGDSMDTDIVAGLEAGLQTALVLSGVSAEGEADRYPYQPTRIVDSVADLIDELWSGLGQLRRRKRDREAKAPHEDGPWAFRVEVGGQLVVLPARRALQRSQVGEL
jgi:hypothetical protein